jgi:predicted small lipoprotein YifL
MASIQLIINHFSRYADRIMKRYHVILFCSMTLMTSACGQPGPLYLPAEEPAAPAQPAGERKPPDELQAPPETTEPGSGIYMEPTP